MISVCIATYNGAKHIIAQVNSIISQLGKEDEIIVSDDCSTDNGIQLLQNLQDERIKILTSTKQQGVIKNIEKALFHSRGEYIFLADQDDIWLPSKVEICLKELQRYDIVQTDATIVNDSLQTIYPSLYHLARSKRGFFNNLRKNSYVGCTMAFRRRVLSVALPFPKNIPMHDQWIGIIGDLVFSVFFIKEPLLLYRRHESAQSTTGFMSPFSLKAKFVFRMNILRSLFYIFLRRYLQPTKIA